MQDFFVTTGKGLEDVLAREVALLGAKGVVADRGGVRFKGDQSDCYRANMWLRTANRVLMPLSSFSCTSPEQLYAGVREIGWTGWITPEMTMSVDCNIRDSAFTHSGFVALKTKDAIVDDIRDRLGRRPNIDTADPDIRVNVHIVKDRCTISLDTSGAPLDRRGYRLDRTEAPLREHVAAALIMLTGWECKAPFVDPMCGSGTIVIEAALMASRRAPGLSRRFGFQRWPGFHPGLWKQVRDEAEAMSVPVPSVPIMGWDKDSSSVKIAGQNAVRAGVGGIVSLGNEQFADLAPPSPPGICLFNPPYGARLGDVETLKPLYRSIGDTMKKRWTGYTCWILAGNIELAKHIGLRPSRRIPVFNGPIECRLLKFDLY